MCGHNAVVHTERTGGDGTSRVFCNSCPLLPARMIGDEGTTDPIPFFIEFSRIHPTTCWEERRRRTSENFLPHSPGPRSENSVIFKGKSWPIDPSERRKPEDQVDLTGYKHDLYFEQEAICVGCRRRYSFDIIQVDHIIPKSKGGGDTVGNLQLLCPTCNMLKGDRDMEHLRMKIRARNG